MNPSKKCDTRVRVCGSTRITTRVATISSHSRRYRSVAITATATASPTIEPRLNVRPRQSAMMPTAGSKYRRLMSGRATRIWGMLMARATLSRLPRTFGSTDVDVARMASSGLSLM